MKNIILAFHIGRGGRFRNQGHLLFIGEKTINQFTDDLFTSHPNLKDFKDRFGYDYTGDKDQKCILDLCSDEDYEELENRFGITEKDLGELEYYDGDGNPVGLTVKELETGIGCIDIDGQYNTTYTTFASNLSEKELKLVIESNPYNIQEILVEFGFDEHYVNVLDKFNILSDILDGRFETNEDYDIFDIEEITQDKYDEMLNDININFELQKVGEKYYLKN